MTRLPHPQQIVFTPVREKILKIKLVVASALLAASGYAYADGTLSNAHFSVTFTTAAQNLFDDPILLGGSDVVRWRPGQFVTDSYAGGVPLVSTALVTIEAAAGYDLSGFRYIESGTFEQGPFGTDPAPTFDTSASGQIKVTPIAPAYVMMTGNFSTGLILTPTFDGNTNIDLGPLNWSTSAGPVIYGAGLKKVQFWVSNSLLANANDSAYSLIRKTTAELTVDTTAVAVVPEPETWAMLLAGMGALVVMARRRRSS